MNAKFRAALIAALLAVSPPAFADYLVNQGSQTTIKSGTLSGGILPWNQLVDSNGNPLGTAINPFAVDFGNGATLPAFAATPSFKLQDGSGNLIGSTTGALNVDCVSGCAGGGGGLSVAFGGAIGTNGTPGGFKDGSGNFQSFLGDITNGQWVSIKNSVTLGVTGTFWPYSLGQQLSASSVPVVLPAAQITTLTPPTSVGITGTLPAFAATPTFNLGTLNGAATAANQTALVAPLSGAATATNAALAGAVYNSTPITLTNTQQAALQADANGYLNVHIQAGGGSGGTSSTFGSAFPTLGTPGGFSQGGNFVAFTGTSGNLNVQCANCSGSGASAADAATFTAGSSTFAPAGGEFTTGGATACVTGHQCLVGITAARAFLTDLSSLAGTALGAGSNYGTSPGAVNVMGVNAFVTNAVTVAQATAASLNATVVNAGTFAVQLTGATNNINNIAGTISLPTGAATSANQPSNSTQGATTAGQTGNLMMGAVTTGSPAYTTAQTSPLSLTTAGALRTDASATTQPVSNAGTFAVQATLQASATTAIGKVDPNTIGSWGLQVSTQNSATPTNGGLVLGQFNTSPTTITSGNVSPLQLDSAGNLLVNIKAGAGSGGTAIADNAAFTQGTTNETPMGCLYISSYSAGTSGHSIIPQCDSTGHPLVNPGTLASWGLVGATTSGATAATNALQAAGVYSSAAPTLTNGQAVALQLTSAGSLHTTVDNTNTNIVPGDAISTTTYGAASPTIGVALLWNGTTYDRPKSAGSTGIAAIGGAAASGSAVAGNPVLIAGSDGTNARSLSTDSTGAPKLAATENHVGEIGSNQIEISTTPTVTASAYTAGNAVGGLQTLANAARVSGTNGASGTGGILAKMVMTVKTVQSTQFDVFIFNANPSGSTCTDNSAFVLAAADAAKVVGVLTIPGTAANGGGWYSGGTGSVGLASYYPIAFSLGSATSLFACAVARGTPTFGSTSDVAFNYNILRD